MPPTRIALSRKERMMAKKPKTICPVSRSQFKQGARPVEITIGGQRMEVPVKFFSTGSLGWYLNAKTNLDVGGQSVPVQIGLNLTLVGSKDLPQEEGTPTPAAAPASSPEPGGQAHGEIA
jgi:hypothetical protein